MELAGETIVWCVMEMAEEPGVSWPLGAGVRIVQSTAEGLVALAKPPGVRSHPNKSAPDRNALLVAPYDAGAEAFVLDNGERVHLLHRLDSPTSGVLLLTQSDAIASEIRAQFADRKVEKVYKAWVRGRLAGFRGVWRDSLRSQRRGGVARTSRGGGDLAITEVRSCAVAGSPWNATLLEMRPKTGRTHQLRVQCAQRRMPILGDSTYGDFRWNREFSRATGEKRLFLHAESITLHFRGHRFLAADPLPESFQI